MAKMSVVGLDEFEQKLQRIETGMRGVVSEAVLNAGAEVLIQGWKDSIRQHGHIKTGAMETAVDKTPIKLEKGKMVVYVYPMGTDGHRVNNAQKAYILSTGRKPKPNGKGGIKGDHFVTKAENQSKQAVHDAMQRVLDQYTGGES